ncbi:MBL fold metallo-hydrolase [Motiliproteus coralliicola]|uniref:MBL fold metallo-hydrolase n=1 Tax=Motiliproteus coralliicola TaxID=2283196 RepID=A0A369WDG0_9GAMM|nr:MBL fold metallo-hydrolase [Motiliproteus coralliicola]RDE19792.1 MBL fold metallo-hydrolase [Motiliproteus coralliicola]
MSTEPDKSTKLFRRTFPVGPLQCNCTLIGDTESGRAIVVDPGGDADKILNELNANGLQLVAIFHTHAHLDHVLAAGALKEKTGAPIYLHDQDNFLWDMIEQQCQMFGVPYVPQPDPDEVIKDDQDLGCCGGVAIHTPGHTPGSTSFWFEEAKLLIAGDTLFRRSIGRTDLWGGDYGQIEKSIKERLYTLDEQAVVVTGHGPDTTIGEEREQNMVIRA